MAQHPGGVESYAKRLCRARQRREDGRHISRDRGQFGRCSWTSPVLWLTLRHPSLSQGRGPYHWPDRQGVCGGLSSRGGAVICPVYSCGHVTAGHDEFRDIRSPYHFRGLKNPLSQAAYPISGSCPSWFISPSAPVLLSQQSTPRCRGWSGRCRGCLRLPVDTSLGKQGSSQNLPKNLR